MCPKNFKTGFHGTDEKLLKYLSSKDKNKIPLMFFRIEKAIYFNRKILKSHSLVKVFCHPAETSLNVSLNLRIQYDFKLAYDHSPKTSSALSTQTKYEILWREKIFQRRHELTQFHSPVFHIIRISLTIAFVSSCQNDLQLMKCIDLLVRINCRTR